MTDLMTFAFSLYTKLRKAPPEIRSRLNLILTEIQTTGAIPLGVHGSEYWWLVYDPSCFSSRGTLDSYLSSRTPRGLTKVTLTI